MESLIENSKLRVCASYCRQERNRKALRNCRIIMLEHILPTTEMFIYHLAEAGAELFAIIAKPYSIDGKVLERLNNNGFNILQYTYDEMETTEVLDILLKNAINKSKKDEKKISIVDIDGYFAAPLTSLEKPDCQYFAGVVEDTTYGHNRYIALANNIAVPIISVARSRLKEIEAHFVGRDAVHAMDWVMRGIDESITGGHAVVIGYGMIGKNVARSLQASDLRVSVYDVRDHRNLKAFMMGFRVNKKAELIRSADIVFAATGWSSFIYKDMRKPALSADDILEVLKSDAILVSVGSKDNEFDVRRLKELAIKPPQQLGQYVTRYTLPNKKTVQVVKDGTAVNFVLPSIPVEILDLVFSEITLSLIFLLKTPHDYPLRQVNVVKEKYWSFIAKDWLRFLGKGN